MKEVFIASLPWIGALLSSVLIAIALRSNARKRLLQSLPTSSTEGVFIGLVELNGTAESEQPLQSHLAGVPCVFYTWSVEEEWRRTVVNRDSKGRTTTRQESGWQTVASGTQMQPFYLKDADGAVLVRPEGAKLEPASLMEHTCRRDDPLYYGKGPAGAIGNSTHRRRFTEQGFALHSPLYIVGRARERGDVVAPEIASDRNAEMFLISAQTEERVISGHRAATIALTIAGVLVLVGALVLWDGLQHRISRDRLPFYGSAVLAYVAAWGIGWSWSVFNALIGLRNRVRHALSLIDVQLQRRHDLIPNLLRIVEALRGHEREVQQAITALRGEVRSTPPGEAGPDPHALQPALVALREAYPELSANQAFLALQKELTSTENRIALARDYFNGIATHYNTCLEQFPDRGVAMIAGMRPQSLLAAEEFQRATVDVNFVS